MIVSRRETVSLCEDWPVSDDQPRASMQPFGLFRGLGWYALTGLVAGFGFVLVMAGSLDLGGYVAIVGAFFGGGGAFAVAVGGLACNGVLRSAVHRGVTALQAWATLAVLVSVATTFVTTFLVIQFLSPQSVLVLALLFAVVAAVPPFFASLPRARREIARRAKIDA